MERTEREKVYGEVKKRKCEKNGTEKKKKGKKRVRKIGNVEEKVNTRKRDDRRWKKQRDKKEGKEGKEGKF